MDGASSAELQVVEAFPEAQVKSIIFSILSVAEAEKISTKIIGAVNEVTDPALGVPNLSNQCTTCGGKCLKACEGHFGLINLPYTVINPFFLPEVAQILNKICPACKAVASGKLQKAEARTLSGGTKDCKYCNGRLKDEYPVMKFKVSPKDTFGKTAIIAEVLSRSRTSSGGIADDYWDFIRNDPQLEKMTLNHKNKRVLSHAQVYDILKDVDPRVFESVLRGRNDMFINSLLVTPNCYRLTEFGQHITFDASTRLYKKLADFKGTANELSTRVFDRFKVSKVRSDKSPDLDSVTTTSGLKYMKEILLTKRNDHSFRMVVVGDPSLKLGEIGVPCQIAEKMRVAEYVNDLNVNELVEKDVPLMLLGDGDLRVRRGGKLMRLSIEDKLQKGDVLYRPLSNGDILLINRPPSIHQHSILALSVKILPISYVLAINPHVCSPLRGDFDGDCLHGYIPQSVNSRIELSELVALSKQLINGQSGKNLLSLSHDSLTAAHLVLEDRVTLNKVQIQQLQMFCPHQQVQLPAIMKTNLANSSFWTGKQLLSLCLPSDFDFTFTSNGVLIRKGEILAASNGSSWLRDTDGNLFYDLIKHCKEDFLDYLFAAQEVLREWLSMRGLSVSLSDLYLASDRCLRENLMNEVSCGLQEAEPQSYISFLMLDHDQDFPFASCNGNEKAVSSATKHISIQQQTSAPISQASISAFKQVFMDIQHLAYQYASKDNAFLIMLKAGSKGSLLKLVQHSMCLGLQNSVVPLSFGIPHHLSCAEWNDYKISHRKAHGIPGHSESYTPWAVVGSSFLTGLNPLECFVHSLTNRDSSFSGHADVSGTINRRIMYFMRDLYVAYDGTVRNAYGNHLVQFSYNNSKDTPTSFNGNNLGPHGITYASESGHPVGLLAASAISEIAYSALELPCSALETSPLLNLKKVLECGVKKSSGDTTASLFLSKKLGRWHYGFEYGVLEVKSHLERLLFSDIISSTMISFSSETSRHSHVSPWVCHFHISKGILKRKKLGVRSIIQALHRQWYSAKKKLKNALPKLQITSKFCSLTENETDAKLCITVSVPESSRNSSTQWEGLRERVMPLLLGSVVKGFSEFKKVDILWKDVNCSKPCKGTPNGLYLRVYMSESCEKIKFWGNLVDSCLQIREMIDWDCSHPDDVNLMTLAYGIDAARMLFLNRLNSAICDAGKTVLPEHLVLTADCLVATGEFVALNAKGLGQQRKEFNVSSPLNQACFSSPGDCFIKAAKKGVVDDLQGTLDALAWGKTPPIGTGADFDIMYSWKGKELTKPTDVYSLMGSHCQEAPKIKLPKKQNEISAKSLAQHLFEDLTSMSHRKLMISKTLKLKLSVKDIQRLSQTLRNLLHKYDIDAYLNEEDKAVVVAALYFHPRKSEKIGTGIMDIKVGCHDKHENSRCFVLERKDGTLEDFSYHKCVHRALQLIAPKRAENYESKWLQGSLTNGKVASVPSSWKSL